MKAGDIIRLLERLGVQPSRKLGQNFLIDPNTLRLIVAAARPEPHELILEIGPGTGVMTSALLEAGSDVIAIEFDARLAAWLREHHDGDSRIQIVEGDACRVDFESLVNGRSYRCVANLPYAVSSIIVGRFLEATNRPTRLTLLLQREMAERLAATSNNKTYGALTVRTQAMYKVKLERIVPPTVFFPPPDIDSAIVTMTPNEQVLPTHEVKPFGDMVRLGFSQRRKRLVKLLSSAYSKSDLELAWSELGFDDGARAEHLTVDDYLNLFRSLQR